MVHIQAAKKILAVYCPDFIEIDGAIFLRQQIPPAGIEVTDYFDLTEAESFYNHLHLLDLFSHQAQIENDENNFWNEEHPDFKAACDIGEIVIKLWAEKLKTEYPHQEFRLYFCVNDNPTIRFHAIRENEANWLDENMWSEQIKAKEIVIIDTRLVNVSNSN